MILFWETIYLVKIAQLRESDGKQYWEMYLLKALKVLALIKPRNLKILWPKAMVYYRNKCLGNYGQKYGKEETL